MNRQQMSFTEHRQQPRTRSFLRGEAVHSNGASRTECTIRDLSDSGARIEAPASVTLPEFFELFVPLRQIHRRARIAWRHGNEIGLSFISETQAQTKMAAPAPVIAPAPDGEDVELSARLHELESETARLRAQLAEMQAVVRQFIHEKKTA